MSDTQRREKTTLAPPRRGICLLLRYSLFPSSFPLPLRSGAFNPARPAKLRHAALRLDQALANGVADELHPVAHAELSHRVRAVVLDRLLGEVQDAGDLAVCVRLGNQLHDLLLAGR